MSLTDPSSRALAVGLFVFAVVLRAPLVAEPLWIDELNTLNLIRTHSALALLWEVPLRQPHFPTYYVLLDVLPGPEARVGRWLSVVAGSLAAPLVYWWLEADLPVGRPTAAVAGLSIASSPLLVAQSAWLRMYALLLVAVLGSWIIAWRWAAGRMSWRAYVVAAAAPISLHPFGLFAVAGQLCWLGVDCRDRPLSEFATAALAVLPIAAAGVTVTLLEFAPWWAAGTVSLGHVAYSSAPLLRATVTPLATLTGTLHTPNAVVSVVGLTVVVGGCALYTRVWATRVGRLALAWVVVPLALLALAHAVYPLWLLKYLGWLAPGVVLLVAASVPTAPARGAVYAALLAVQLHGLFLLYQTTAELSRVAVYGIDVRPF